MNDGATLAKMAAKSKNIEIAYQKAIRDYNHLMYQSRQEGAYDKAVETTKNFLKLGLKPQMIAEGTGLSIEEINQRQKDMDLNINK